MPFGARLPRADPIGNPAAQPHRLTGDRGIELATSVLHGLPLTPETAPGSTSERSTRRMLTRIGAKSNRVQREVKRDGKVA